MNPPKLLALALAALLAWEFWDIKKNKVDGGVRAASPSGDGRGSLPVVGPRCLR